jgi:hypothetical protein
MTQQKRSIWTRNLMSTSAAPFIVGIAWVLVGLATYASWEDVLSPSMPRLPHMPHLADTNSWRDFIRPTVFTVAWLYLTVALVVLIWRETSPKHRQRKRTQRKRGQRHAAQEAIRHPLTDGRYCGHCGYDVTGSSIYCPECGAWHGRRNVGA